MKSFVTPNYFIIYHCVANRNINYLCAISQLTAE